MLPISLTIGVPPGVGVLSDGREQNAALDQRTLFLRALAAWALSAESGLAGSLTLDALDRYAEDPRDALALAEATGADLLLWPIPIIGPPDALEWRAVRPTWVGALGAAIGRAVQPMGKSSTVGRLPWKRRLEPGSPLLRWGREAVQLLLYEFAAHSGLWRAASVYAQSLVDSAPDSLARRSLLIECWLQLNDPDRLEEEAVALERLTTNAVVRSSGRRLRGIAEGMRGRLSQELARYMEAGLIGEDTPEEEQASRAIRDMLRRLGGTYPFYTEVPDPNAYRILIRWAQICKGSAATCVAFSTESTVFNIALATGPGKESVRVRVGAYANHLKEPSSTHLVWKHGLEVFDDDYDWKCVVPKNPPRDES